MVTIIDGLIGGLIATIIMTAFQMALGGDDPPPTSLFWSKYVGSGEPDDYLPQGMILHLLYGTIAGVILAVVAIQLAVVSFGSLTDGLIWGLGYGVVLFVGAAIFWMRIVLDIDANAKMVGAFLFFHLVYGAVLGAWLALDLLG